jgi:hypothetical protein
VWGNGHDKATVTVTAVDAHGAPVSGQQIDLAATPSSAATIVPDAVATDSSGRITFTVTSDVPIDPNSTPSPTTLTATSASAPYEAPGTTDITFVRHKVVVQFLGIITALDCSGGTSDTCTDPKAGTDTPNDLFVGLRGDAVGNLGFEPTDFLWYSYTGGTTDSSTGDWIPNSYGCADTADGYDVDLANLKAMITGYTTANPNTDLYLIAHSQGGLIAFQQLALSDLSGGDHNAAVVALDAPLGGVPGAGTSITSAFTCWKGKAPHQLTEFYKALPPGGSHSRQGDSSRLLCAFLNQCPGFAATTNAQMATQAEANGTPVYTYGSTDDAVYTPSKCSLPALFHVPSTQVVSTATAGGLSPFDHVVGTLGTCIYNTHVAVVAAEESNIAGIIGPQR